MKIKEIEKLFKLIDEWMSEPLNYGAYYSLENSDEREDESFNLCEDKKNIYITMEFRGFQEEDIQVKIEPYKVILEILYNGKVYSKSINLPCRVKTKGKINFNNCILDVTLMKDKRKNGKIKKT